MDLSIGQGLGQVVATGQPAWKARLIAIEAALAMNVVILAVARLATDEFPVASMGGDDQAIGFLPVIVVTLLAGFAAWGSLVVLEQTTLREGDLDGAGHRRPRALPAWPTWERRRHCLESRPHAPAPRRRGGDHPVDAAIGRDARLGKRCFSSLRNGR